MPPGVVHFRNCTCANRSRVLACGATGLRVSGWSVLRTVPEAFTPGPRFWGCGRGSALCGAGECCKEASHALRPILLHAGGEVLFARQGSVACGVPARRAGLVRGRGRVDWSGRCCFFPSSVLAGCWRPDACRSRERQAPVGVKRDNPKTVRPSGCRLGQVPAISFRASGRRCRVQGCGTVRIPPANSPASSRRACRSSPTSSVR